MFTTAFLLVHYLPRQCLGICRLWNGWSENCFGGGGGPEGTPLAHSSLWNNSVLGKRYPFGQPIILFWKTDTLRLLKLDYYFLFPDGRQKKLSAHALQGFLRMKKGSRMLQRLLYFVDSLGSTLYSLFSPQRKEVSHLKMNNELQ